MFINRGRGEISLKIVYYGPARSGKTTNLQILHERTPADFRSDLMSIKTEGDRTLFFDFLQLEIGKIMGMTPKFKLYTVPGQSYYKSSRRLVLQGVDGVVFVADSEPKRLLDNLIAWRNLKEHLESYRIDRATFPIVVQANKRDVPHPLPVAMLGERLGVKGIPIIEATAVSGQGVLPTLKLMVQSVLTAHKEFFGAIPATPPTTR